MKHKRIIAPLMAGHSKFKNIQFRKGAQDKKRAREFSRLVRELVTAARSGAPDPAQNPRLRTAMQNARAANMPKDNIERAINRAGQSDDVNYEEVRYEGFCPGGAGVIINTLTDNRNRTASHIRSAFAKHGGRLGESNTVAFLFEQTGEITVPANNVSHDQAFALALEYNASDCRSEKDAHIFVCPPASLHKLAEKLDAALEATASAHLVWRAKEPVELSREQTESAQSILAALEDIDDVQNVWTNAALPDAPNEEKQ